MCVCVWLCVCVCKRERETYSVIERYSVYVCKIVTGIEKERKR